MQLQAKSNKSIPSLLSHTPCCCHSEWGGHSQHTFRVDRAAPRLENRPTPCKAHALQRLEPSLAPHKCSLSSTLVRRAALPLISTLPTQPFQPPGHCRLLPKLSPRLSSTPLTAGCHISQSRKLNLPYKYLIEDEGRGLLQKFSHTLPGAKVTANIYLRLWKGLQACFPSRWV